MKPNKTFYFAQVQRLSFWSSVLTLILLLSTTIKAVQHDDVFCKPDGDHFKCEGCARGGETCFNCTVSPVYNSNDPLFTESYFFSSCRYYLSKKNPHLISPAFSVKSKHFRPEFYDATYCNQDSACLDIWFNARLGTMLADVSLNDVASKAWYMTTVLFFSQDPHILVSSYFMPPLNLFEMVEPPLALRGELISSPGESEHRIILSVDPSLNSGELPWARFYFTATNPCKTNCDLHIDATFNNEHKTYTLHSLIAELEVGPLVLGAHVTAKVSGIVVRVARAERLGEIFSIGTSQQLQFFWRNIASPGVLGTVSVKGPHQSLSHECTRKGEKNFDYHCFVPLSGLPPQPWILIRAGSLPDAKTHNMSTVHLWQMSGFQIQPPEDQLSGTWKPAFAAAEGYQLSLSCPNGQLQHDTIDPSVNLSTPLYGLCNLTLTPKYRGQFWPELGLAANMNISFEPDPEELNAEGVAQMTIITFTAITGLVTIGFYMICGSGAVAH